ANASVVENVFPWFPNSVLCLKILLTVLKLPSISVTPLTLPG
ncbi:hypothetical protein chiPu_0026153, partial [Chiloscyllium punctatum]|nr:hypothetical protein [Chiloscyllium punctatum]